jgi:hypothetical protein
MATVQTGLEYSILTPLYVEAIFAIAGILFRMVQSFFCCCQVPVLEGAKHISFSQFSCEKLICFAPSKAVPCFLDGATRSIIIFPKYFK